MTEEELAGFIIAKDECREGQGWQPPVEFEGVHAQALVHSRGIGQKGGQAGFKDQAKVQEPIGHALLDH